MLTPRTKSFLIRGFSHLINIVMVAVVYLSTVNSVPILGLVLFGLSKWRVFSGRLRSWPRNILLNGCDIAFGFSVIVLMQYYFERSKTILIALAVILLLWQLVIKPITKQWAVSIQALLCQLVSLTAIWTIYPGVIDQGFIVISLSALASFFNAYHILRQLPDLVEIEFAWRLSLVWMSVVAQFSWLSWLWNVQYQVVRSPLVIPQIALLSGLLGYYLLSVFINSNQQITKQKQRRFLLTQSLSIGLVIIAIVVFTPWSSSIQ